MNARFTPVAMSQVQPARQEDLRLITGQGRFTADVHYPGELHVDVIRSMHAHGRIAPWNRAAEAMFGFAPTTSWPTSPHCVDALTRFRQGAALPDVLTFLGFEITR